MKSPRGAKWARTRIADAPMYAEAASLWSRKLVHMRLRLGVTEAE